MVCKAKGFEYDFYGNRPNENSCTVGYIDLSTGKMVTKKIKGITYTDSIMSFVENITDPDGHFKEPSDPIGKLLDSIMAPDDPDENHKNISISNNPGYLDNEYNDPDEEVYERLYSKFSTEIDDYNKQDKYFESVLCSSNEDSSKDPSTRQKKGLTDFVKDNLIAGAIMLPATLLTSYFLIDMSPEKMDPLVVATYTTLGLDILAYSFDPIKRSNLKKTVFDNVGIFLGTYLGMSLSQFF